MVTDDGWRSQLKKLNTQKRHAVKKNNQIMISEICGEIGDLLFSVELYKEALIEYKLKYDIENRLDLVNGLIKTMLHISNVYVELQAYDEAIDIINDRIKVIDDRKLKNNIINAQSLVYLARIRYLEGMMTESNDKRDDLFHEAVSLNQQSLDLLSTPFDQQHFTDIHDIEDSLPANEQLTTSTLFNIGMIYDNWNRIDNAKAYFEKSLNMATQYQLETDQLKAIQAIATIYMKQKQHKLAKSLYKKAIKIIRKMESSDQTPTEELIELQYLLGKCYLSVGNVNKAKKMFLFSYNYIHRLNELDQKLLKKYLKNCIKAQKIIYIIRNKEDNCIKDDIIMDYYEELGDLFSSMSNKEMAIEFYNKQLTIAQTLFDKSNNDIFPPIYRSLALTYKDIKDFPNAITYYKLYVGTLDDNPNEKAIIWCSLARCEQKLNTHFQNNRIVLECYKNAKKYAELANLPGFIAYCLSKIASIERNHNNFTDAIIYENELHEIRSKYTNEFVDRYMSEMSQSSSQSQNCESDSSGQFILESVLNSSDDKENQFDIMSNSSSPITKSIVLDKSKNRKHTLTRGKNSHLSNILKRNELGETLLHQACIKGDHEKVLLLLERGADVNTRDYSGWQPIHEVSNHGYLNILQILIEHNADVNDSGGKYCGGITPLMDSVQNGHKKCVKLLLENGANPHHKDSNNKTAIDYLNKIDDNYLDIYNLLNDAIRTNPISTIEDLPEVHHSNRSDKNLKSIKKTSHDKIINKLAHSSKSMHIIFDQTKEIPLVEPRKNLRKLKPGEIPLIPSDIVQLSSRQSIICDNQSPVKIPKKKAKKAPLSPTNRFKSNNDNSHIINDVTLSHERDYLDHNVSYTMSKRNCRNFPRKSHSFNVDSPISVPHKNNQGIDFVDKIRVNIQIEGIWLYVAILRDNFSTYTIQNLRDEVQLRYYSKLHKQVEISLTTEKGAVFQENDLVINVCNDNDDLYGSVIRFLPQSLLEMYYNTSKQYSLDSYTELNEFFSHHENLQKFDSNYLLSIKPQPLNNILYLDLIISTILNFIQTDQYIGITHILFVNIVVNSHLMEKLAQLVLQLYKSLETIKLSNIFATNNDAYYTFFNLFRHNKRLNKVRFLEISFVDMGNISSNHLAYFISHFPNLDTLCVNFCGSLFSDSFYNPLCNTGSNDNATLSNTISRLENLTDISINGLLYHTIDGSHFFNCLPWNRRFNNLCLTHNSKVTNFVSNLVNFFKISSCVVNILDLSSTPCSNFFSNLFSLSTQCFLENINELNLSNCSIDNRDLDILISNVHRLSTLQKLDISSNHSMVTKFDSLKLLFNKVISLESLEFVNLADTINFNELTTNKNILLHNNPHSNFVTSYQNISIDSSDDKYDRVSLDSDISSLGDFSPTLFKSKAQSTKSNNQTQIQVYQQPQLFHHCVSNVISSMDVERNQLTIDFSFNNVSNNNHIQDLYPMVFENHSASVSNVDCHGYFCFLYITRQ